MLTNTELLEIFSRLMSVCVFFTNCMQVCTASLYWPCHCQLLWVPGSYNSPFFHLDPSSPQCTWKSLCTSLNQQGLGLDWSNPHSFSQMVSMASPSTKFSMLFCFCVGIRFVGTELPLFRQSCSRIWGVSCRALWFLAYSFEGQVRTGEWTRGDWSPWVHPSQRLRKPIALKKNHLPLGVGSFVLTLYI